MSRPSNRPILYRVGKCLIAAQVSLLDKYFPGRRQQRPKDARAEQFPFMRLDRETRSAYWRRMDIARLSKELGLSRAYIREQVVGDIREKVPVMELVALEVERIDRKAKVAA